jgi:hypothetical protein
MSDDFPIEQHIFDLRTLTDVVQHFVTTPETLLIYYHPNVRVLAIKVPRNDISRTIVIRVVARFQIFAELRKENLQIRHAPVIDVRIGMPPVQRILREVLHHIFMHLFLQIDANRPVDANNLIGSCAGVGRNITTRVSDSDIISGITHVYLRSRHRRSDQLFRELGVRSRILRRCCER